MILRLWVRGRNTVSSTIAVSALLFCLFGLTVSYAAENATPAVSSPSQRNVLAISWQPAFCETRPRTPECRSQTAERMDARQFSLHGLWPQPRSLEYCGLPADAGRRGRWEDLPTVDLSQATRATLASAMPGMQSGLERHEWMRHGTCFGTSAESYFAVALALLGEVNASAVQKLFADNVGSSITAEQVRSAFDESFGSGAGERVRLSCAKDGERRIIVELTIGLAGETSEAGTARLGDLVRASKPTAKGCPAGFVDAVGQD